MRELILALAFTIAATATARAAVEFCPATAGVPFPIGAAFGTPAREFGYELNALTPRNVTATLIADTSAGWYRWDVDGVALTTVIRPFRPRSIPRNFFPESFAVAASPTLAVTFPTAVTIHHLWITTAGGSSCDVPAFDQPSDSLAPDTDQVSRTPSPRYVTVAATASDPPFDIVACARPFAASTVTRPIPPELPLSTRESLSYGGGLWAAVEVALDPAGHLVDAWIYASSADAAWNRSALRAARLSTYAGGVSYCRPANGTYLFLATVVPN
jgi:hypothetical protein